MRILGIDPGLQATGYGVVDVEPDGRMVCRAAGVIKPDSKEMAARVLQIHDQLEGVLHEFIPDCMAVEDLYTVYEHPRTAILMGHARGVIFLAAAERAVPVTSYSPAEVKRAVTGNGRASKMQVQSMIFRLLHLPETPLPDHVTDALALALCHMTRAQVAARSGIVRK